MDPLDPLTEIVKSGQVLSPLIFLERLIWLFIGFFFIGAMTSGLKNGLKSQGSPKILSAIRGKKISDIVLKREAK